MTDQLPNGRVTAKLFPHPLNAWYAVAWDHEVTGKGLLARTVAGKPMAHTRNGSPYRRSASIMRQILVIKPRPAKPEPEIDTRTPAGRVLPY